ncbi:MAG: UxaA family hydrolase [Geminicoccaceae bacterium]|nr:UxaA family hydrolase [Geminicoccaceae bacterium]HRY25373.1 UxaA family hydrolase [Geminicoccaceae bacterium]
MSGSTALRLAATDNVATALRDLEAGEVVEIEDQRIELLERIPLCHKLALADLAPGTPVTKYGQPIGRTTTAVARGAHVHVHNMKSARAQAPRPAR